MTNAEQLTEARKFLATPNLGKDVMRELDKAMICIRELADIAEAAEARVKELEAATRVPVHGEPNGDRHEMSEHSVVAYHQWRNSLGRDRLSDDEGTAARIAFYAGWDHARAVTPEPDWEYGLRTRSKSDPVRGFFSYAGDLETAWEMYGATYEHCTATIVRRRKAGEWVPVESEVSDG